MPSGLRGCDWVIEAVVERLDVKQALVERVERRPATRRSSSRTPRASRWRASRRSEPPRSARRWLGTHFFNPPRYLRAARGHSDGRYRSRGRPQHRRVRRQTAGQGRRPREGHAGLHRQSHRHLRPDAGVQGDERGRVRSRRGRRHHRPAIGRPKSATFRTMDLAGLDILGAVARDLGQRLRSGGAACLCDSTRRRRAGPAWLGRLQGRPGVLPEAAVAARSKRSTSR